MKKPFWKNLGVVALGCFFLAGEAWHYDQYTWGAVGAGFFLTAGLISTGVYFFKRQGSDEAL